MITTNHVFVAFGDQVARARAWLALRVRAGCGYPKEVLLDRLAQRLVDVGLGPYAYAASARVKRGEDRVPTDGTTIDCRIARFELGTGRLRVPVKHIIREYVAFLSHWAYCLMAMAIGTLRGRDTTPAVLVQDLSEADLFSGTTDAPFISFCRLGPIVPLREGRRFLIASSADRRSSEPGVFTYCRYPLISLARASRLGWGTRARLFARHLALLWSYHLAIVTAPQLSLVGRELAYRELSAALDREGLIDGIVLTCSSYRHQPMWTRALTHTRVHMVWYAQNWRPLSRRSGDLTSDFPSLRWIRADVHWVWTKTFAAYLRTLVPGDVRAVGPIVWRLPETAERTKGITAVTVFDVPAVSDEVMIDPNGEITNHFHPDRLRRFIEDLFAFRAALADRIGRPVSLRLKMKRGFRPDYAKEYYDYIDEVVAQGRVEIVEPVDNLFSLISQSDFVIAYPFTSPLYVAEAIGVPSVYYDPSGALMPIYFADTDLVQFASGPVELLARAEEALRVPRAFTSSPNAPVGPRQ